MDDMTIFVPIAKIDAAQCLVYGVVTAVAPDASGEVYDYASTKPFYQNGRKIWPAPQRAIVSAICAPCTAMLQ